MLATQNETLITIENQIDQAEDAVQQASNEMVKAVEIRKKSRKLLWIITIIVVILLLLLGIYIYANVIKPAKDTVESFVPKSDNNNNNN